MDAGAAQDVRRLAYGQAVWSWPPDAGVKPLDDETTQGTVAKKPGTPGREHGGSS